MRCFLAMPLAPGTAQELYEKREMLRFGYRGLKWITPGQFHVTLFFFGEISNRQAGEIIARSDSIMRNFPPFPVSFDGPGQFPVTGRPRVIYESVGEGSESCRELYRKLQTPLDSVAERKKRKFHPHVTLARVNPGFHNFPPEGTGVTLLPVKGNMSEAVLYESILKREGAHYLPLATWTLKNREEKS